MRSGAINFASDYIQMQAGCIDGRRLGEVKRHRTRKTDLIIVAVDEMSDNILVVHVGQKVTFVLGRLNQGEDESLPV